MGRAIVGVTLVASPGRPAADRPPQPQDTEAPTAGDEPGDPATVLETLVHNAATAVGSRFGQPLGQVVERKRSRVYVALEGEVPRKGTHLKATRRIEDFEPHRERLITRLRVQGSTEGLVECKEFDRAGRDHAEPGDLVRTESSASQILLAPCVSLVELAPIIPQVVGEKLRRALLGRPGMVIVSDVDVERQAESAYWSGDLKTFLATVQDVDIVLVPVLLRTTKKLVLNLEYYAVQQQRAVEIDVASVTLDNMTQSWLRAGRTRDRSPPGFLALPSQTFAWSLQAITALDAGRLLVVSRDSVRVLDFVYPGLQPRGVVALGPRDRTRRQPYVTCISPHVLRELLLEEVDDLQSSVDELDVGVTWIACDERAPLAVRVDDGEPRVEHDREPVQLLERLWVTVRGEAVLSRRWWPRAGGERLVVQPLFADVDNDERRDLVWSDPEGVLWTQRRAGTRAESLEGFGDVKACQPRGDNGTNAVLWLTDPVWNGANDHLHAAQFIDGKLRIVWRSPSFRRTIVGLASSDLNGDAAADLVVAEAVAGGTRLHLFMALPGERTAARGGPWSP